MAIGFQIDHYDPIMDDRNDYSNLFWACSPCNRTKGDFWALRSSVRELGYALIRIDQTHPNDHFELVGLRLEPKTKTGETSITLLRLNRKNLLTLREARRDLGEGEGLIMNGVRELFGLEIDRLTPENRGIVLRLRERVRAEVAALCTTIEELVEHSTRSAMVVDDDPGADEDRRAVRAFLNEVGALGPELTTMRRAEKRLGSSPSDTRRSATQSRKRGRAGRR